MSIEVDILTKLDKKLTDIIMFSVLCSKNYTDYL